MVESLVESGERLKSKSGYTPEELFDVLVTYNNFGTETNPASVVKRKVRGAAKNVLRTFGVSDETVSSLLSTKQTALIRSEIGNLPGDQQAEFMLRLCALEKDRVMTAISETIAELHDSGILRVELLGSMNSSDRWPNDVDVNLHMLHSDVESVRLFRKILEEKTHKKVDVKNIILTK